MRSRKVAWAGLVAMAMSLPTVAMAARGLLDDGVCAFAAPAVDPVWRRAGGWTVDIDAVWPRRLDALRIYVPAGPSADEITTALALAARAARRSPTGNLLISVEALDPSGPEPFSSVSPHERTIVVSAASGRGPRLLVGSDPTADKSLPVLAIDALDPRVVDPPATIGDTVSSGRNRFTFRELGLEPEPLGPTRRQLTIRFSEADLGGPVAAASLRVSAHCSTWPAGGAAHLAILVNGGLVELIELGKDTVFERSVRVPSSLLQRVNTVSVRLAPDRAVWPTRESDHAELPTVALDGDSFLEVAHGQRLAAGLERFPQALVPAFEVSFDRATPKAIESAARVVAAMQRGTSSPLRPRVVSWEHGRSGRGPWLAVAQDRLLAASLEPPLPPGPFRIVDGRGREVFRSPAESRFAALEAFSLGGRDVLLLTHNDWLEGLARPGASLAAQRGWDGIGGEVWLVPHDGLPFALRLAERGLTVESLSNGPRLVSRRARDLSFLAGLFGLAGFLAWSFPRLVRSGAGGVTQASLASHEKANRRAAHASTPRRRERTAPCP